MVSVANSQPSRQGYRSGVVIVGPGVLPAKPGEVQPAFFSIGELAGCIVVYSPSNRWSAVWVDASASYAKPGAAPYQLSFSARIGGPAGGVQSVFARSCSCPDAQHRAAAGAKPGSAAAQCKHLVALAAELQSEPVSSRHLLWGVFVSAVCSDPSRVRSVREGAAA